MFQRSWGRFIAAAAIACAPAMAGDYDHVFDVVKATWPERQMAMAFCDKDANQMALIDLADTAKERNISLVIVDMKDEKEYNKTMINALARNPGFILIIDEDPLLGTNGRLTARMIYRVSGRLIPTVGINKAALSHGAILTAGSGAKDPVYGSKTVAKQLKLTLPEGAVDPSEGKGK
jgi:hypothetical protein